MRGSLAIAVVIACFCLPARAAEPLKESAISDLDREHWAFQPLERPKLPAVKDEHNWARTPIDRFIQQPLERKAVRPQAEASKATLLRRVTFDLMGMPPTPTELEAFTADTSPDAYEHVVDRLLASPRYGERWGQFWLDLARFAETDGFEHDKVRAQAWKYRDWVIGAFNRDLPYDQFIALQLAGDELRPGDEDAKTATMFCLAGPDMPDINAQDQRRHDLLNEMTGTVGSVVMAMQFGCAQCHDHKYDPISQGDFYRLRAFFTAAVKVQREKPVSTLAETSADAEPSFLYLRGDLQRPGPAVKPAFPRIVNTDERPVRSPPSGAKSSQRRAALAQWLTQPNHPLTARVIANRLWQQHFGRGLSNTPSDFGLVGEEPSHPALLDWLAVELVEHDWSVKHVQRLIVTSAVYRQAGVQGSEVRAQEDKTANPEPRTPVPADLFASFPRQRLSAEAIRDAMLTASGQLNEATCGPGVMPPLAKEVEQTLLKDQWKVSENGADYTRRSIYIFARRNLRYPLLEAFDKADPNQTCAARHVSTTAPQALMMLNSRFSLETAQHLAGRALHAADGKLFNAVDQVYLAAYARLPSEEERKLAADFLAKQSTLLKSEERQADQLALPVPGTEKITRDQAAAFVDYCLAILNSSEFVYVD